MSMDDPWWREEFQAAIENGFDPPGADEAFMTLKARINLVAVVSPDLGVPGLGQTGMKEFLAKTFSGEETQEQVERMDLIAALQSFMGETRFGWLDEIVPLRFEMKSGTFLKLRYSPESDPDRGEARNPEADVRLHQIMDCTEHPFACEGLAAVRLHLRDPKGAVIDRTFDWLGWKTSELPGYLPRLRAKFPQEFPEEDDSAG
jgi:ATP-dependent helicase HrpB